MGDAGEVKIGNVDELSPDEVRDAGLIVAGGPTHAHGMAKPNAHKSLAGDESYQQYGQVLPGEETLRDWLERLPEGYAKAAAFDTRYRKPMFVTGSAAKKIGIILKSKGHSVVAAHSFFVEPACLSFCSELICGVLRRARLSVRPRLAECGWGVNRLFFQQRGSPPCS